MIIRLQECIPIFLRDDQEVNEVLRHDIWQQGLYRVEYFRKGHRSNTAVSCELREVFSTENAEI